MVALDHTSLVVGDVAQAALFLEERLGFRLTLTPQAPDSHGRIFLDRTYVEVSTGNGPATDGTTPLLGAWSMVFLRTADPYSFGERARHLGLRPSGPAVYHGHDGDWLEVELRARVPRSLLPIVLQRITPADVAANWPPPLAEPHPNGAHRLASVCLLAQNDAQAEVLVDVLARAAASAPRDGRWRLNPYFQASQRSVHFANGGRVDILYPRQSGPAAQWLESRGPGILAGVFATASREQTGAGLVQRGFPFDSLRDDGRCLWLEPGGPLGVHVGFEG